MEIKFYEDSNGHFPVKGFLDSLDIKMRQKMLRSIQALQEMGVSLRMPLSESLQAFLRNYLYIEKGGEYNGRSR